MREPGANGVATADAAAIAYQIASFIPGAPCLNNIKAYQGAAAIRSRDEVYHDD
jgi:hypothetical protein